MMARIAAIGALWLLMAAPARAFDTLVVAGVGFGVSIGPANEDPAPRAAARVHAFVEAGHWGPASWEWPRNEGFLNLVPVAGVELGYQPAKSRLRPDITFRVGPSFQMFFGLGSWKLAEVRGLLRWSLHEDRWLPRAGVGIRGLYAYTNVLYEIERGSRARPRSEGRHIEVGVEAGVVPATALANGSWVPGGY